MKRTLLITTRLALLCVITANGIVPAVASISTCAPSAVPQILSGNALAMADLTRSFWGLGLGPNGGYSEAAQKAMVTSIYNDGFSTQPLLNWVAGDPSFRVPLSLAESFPGAGTLPTSYVAGTLGFVSITLDAGWSRVPVQL